MTTKPKTTAAKTVAPETGDHPALAPEARTSAADVQNRIDMNDPDFSSSGQIVDATDDPQD